MRLMYLTPMVILVAIAGPSSARDACQAGFGVDGPASLMGTPPRLQATMTARHGECAFAVRLGASPGAPTCEPQGSRSFTGRDASLFAGPDGDDTPEGCGAWSTVTVKLRNGRKARRHLRARTVEDKQRVRATLVCEADTSPSP